MHRYEANICGRSMRWYEWLLALILMGLAGGVRAEAVYKCTGDGTLAYQDTPCAQALQERVELTPAPAYSPSPVYAMSATVSTRGTRARSARRELRDARADVSYECRVSNGDVFYRHSPCPHTVPGTAKGDKSGAHSATAGAQKLSVSAREISRAEACTQIHRSGSIGRGGHQHDEDVSTYDRNLGRDPCK